MKVKVKFDLASIKTWIFEHGEKLAFGLMVLVFLMFMYSAAKREVLEATKQPDKLQQVANQVTSHVADSKWDEKRTGVQIVDYQQRAKRESVPHEKFPINVPLSTPLIDPKGKRDDPEIFNAEELRASAGIGTFALRGDNVSAGSGGKPAGGKQGQGIRPTSSSKLKAQAWAVVTALVPTDKQAKEYSRVFSRAMGESAERDVPRYSGAIFERAQIDPANPDKLDWTPVDAMATFEAQWEVRGDEIVLPIYVDPELTSPLGPLVGAAWGESVAHPKIPPMWVTERQAEITAAAATAASAKANTVAADAAEAASGGRVRRAPAAPPTASAPVAARPSTTSYKLLRVFDYSVKPNTRYRYRVKLELQNPNYKLNPRFLKKPEAPSNKQEFRVADQWSDPTDVVAIPNGFDVLAGTVEPKGAEPVVNLLLTAVDGENGIPVSTKVRLYRGSVANKKESKVNATDPRNLQIVAIQDVDFKTGMVVLDIYGGKTVSTAKNKEKPMTAPGEVLLWDAQGGLVVHNDLDDLTQFENRQPPDDTDTAKK
jgi:hypothetical protein